MEAVPKSVFHPPVNLGKDQFVKQPAPFTITPIKLNPVFGAKPATPPAAPTSIPQSAGLTDAQVRALASPPPNLPPPPVSDKVVPRPALEGFKSDMPVESTRTTDEFHTHQRQTAEGTELHIQREPANFVPVIFLANNAPNLKFTYTDVARTRGQFQNGRFVCETQEALDKFLLALQAMSVGARAMIRRLDKNAAAEVARAHRESMNANAHSHRGPMTSAAMGSGMNEIEKLRLQQEAGAVGADPNSAAMRELMADLNGGVDVT